MHDNTYLQSDIIGDAILAILGTVPKRWGRMDQASRLAVVEVGRSLRVAGLINHVRCKIDDDKIIGLIGGTRRGSLATDLAYGETYAQGLDMASPVFFSYTLANIALAEAASHYGLTGPVYSVYHENPFEEAAAEAKRWLAGDSQLYAMLAGELDFVPTNVAGGPVVSAFFEVVKQ